MATSIEWTDETWNPVVGCERVSPGCDRCYAIGVAHRAMQPAHVGLTVHRPGERTDWTGEVRCLPDRLKEPQRWTRPRRVFVNSMSDLFHPDVPSPFIAQVFAAMMIGHWHTFQVLTKRPQRMPRLLDDATFRCTVSASIGSLLGVKVEARHFDGVEGARALGREISDARHAAGMPRWFDEWPPRNVWLGTSIEHRRFAFRANALRETPAAVRFISAEPLLGHLGCDLDLTGIDWLIVGAESGHGARPMDLDWARALRDRCAEEGVAFFVKQLTGFAGRPVKDLADFPPDLRIREFPAQVAAS